MKIYNRRFIALSLMPLFVVGCVHLFGKAKSEEALRERINKEWEAKIRGDWGSVYDLTRNDFKKTSERNKFIRRANLKVEKFSIKEVRIDSAQGKGWALVTFDINQKEFPFKGINSKEEWIWEDNQWRLNLKLSKAAFDK